MKFSVALSLSVASCLAMKDFKIHSEALETFLGIQNYCKGKLEPELQNTKTPCLKLAEIKGFNLTSLYPVFELIEENCSQPSGEIAHVCGLITESGLFKTS